MTGPVGGGGDVGEAELLEKPYHCNPPCEFSTTTKGNLLQHQNNSRCYHKRPFACDKCSQRFTTQHGKDQHFVKGRCGVWVWRGDPSMMWFCIAFIDALKITYPLCALRGTMQCWCHCYHWWHLVLSMNQFRVGQRPVTMPGPSWYGVTAPQPGNGFFTSITAAQPRSQLLVSTSAREALAEKVRCFSVSFPLSVDICVMLCRRIQAHLAQGPCYEVSHWSSPQCVGIWWQTLFQQRTQCILLWEVKSKMMCEIECHLIF